MNFITQKYPKFICNLDFLWVSSRNGQLIAFKRKWHDPIHLRHRLTENIYKAMCNLFVI